MSHFRSLPGCAPTDPRHVPVPLVDAEDDEDYVTTESDYSEEEQEDPNDYCRGCTIVQRLPLDLFVPFRRRVSSSRNW